MTHELHALLHYAPSAGQAQFHLIPARFKLLIAGARFGKSLAAARDVLPDLLAGRSRGWLAAPTFSLAQPEYRYLFSDLRGSLGDDAPAAAGGRKQASTLRPRWGAELASVSAHQPETLLGEELDWLVLCEAAHLQREAFERYLRARLATRAGRLVVPTTPRGHNWIHGLYERGLGGKAHWASFRFATWDNPRISAGEIEEARATLPPDVFDEQFGGAFVSASGRVYPEFQPARHVQAVEAAGGVLHCGLDFGYTNPLVCLFATLDADDGLHVLDEYYATQRTLGAHAHELLQRLQALVAAGMTRGHLFADPAGRQEREELLRLGLPTQPAENAVPAGIDAVRALLTRQRGLVVHPRCVNLVREFEAYRWDESPGHGERIPIKKDDHALDALRYLVLGLARRVGWKPVR